MHDFELRLIGHHSEAGQILAQDMVNLAGSAQTLITRLARAAAERRGPGRSELALEQLSRVRVTALGQGSTTIGFIFGDASAFDLDDPISREIDETFWLIAEGLNHNRRPAVVTDSTAAAVDELIGNLRHAAPIVEVRSRSRAPIELKSESLERSVWQSSLNAGTTPVSYIGVLEALDLRNGVFRIADDVENRILLRDVHAPHEAALLVDRRVRATGRPVYGSDGELKHLMDVEVAPLDLPSEWNEPGRDLATLLRSTPSPSANSGLDLTDEEFDEFMAAIDG